LADGFGRGVLFLLLVCLWTMDLVVGTCLGDGNLGSLRVVFWRYRLRVTLLGCWIGLEGGLRVSGRGGWGIGLGGIRRRWVK
jgi:hypothetical protein